LLHINGLLGQRPDGNVLTPLASFVDDRVKTGAAASHLPSVKSLAMGNLSGLVRLRNAESLPGPENDLEMARPLDRKDLARGGADRHFSFRASYFTELERAVLGNAKDVSAVKSILPNPTVASKSKKNKK
jgi:hypothetical protein